MKVCLLNDSFPPVIDGVANVVMNYARIMQTEHLAACMVGTPKYPNTDYSIYPYDVVPYSSLDTTKIVKGYRAGNPLDIKELITLSEFHPDIIHTHCPVASAYVGRMLRAKCDVPLIFTYHTKFDEDIARAVKNEFIQKETVKVLINNVEACDEVWVVSQGAGENMRSLGYQGDYRVVSNGVDFAKGRVSQEEVALATKDYDLPEGVPVFLFVGRIIAYKGIPHLLDACARLSQMGMDYRMVFVGSGPDLEQFKKQAKQAGIYENPDSNQKGKCIFTGPIYDRDVLRAWNTRADLFLFPSTYDTNGIVVREAAACGLASVLIEGSCAAEGITDDRNGFLTQQNGESIAELLLRICQDLNHVHEVGQNAMDEIYISWEDSVHAAHARYAEIIELRKAGKFPIREHSLTYPIKKFTDEMETEFKNFYHMQLTHTHDMDLLEDSSLFFEEYAKKWKEKADEKLTKASEKMQHVADKIDAFSELVEQTIETSFETSFENTTEFLNQHTKKKSGEDHEK